MSNPNRRNPARRSRYGYPDRFATSGTSRSFDSLPERQEKAVTAPSPLDIQSATAAPIPTVLPPVQIAASDGSAPPATAVAIMTGIAALGLLCCLALLLFAL